MGRKKRKNIIPVPVVRWGHSQRPTECCKTHHAITMSDPCYDCQTLSMAESVVGRAMLLLHGYRFQRPQSVLDALILAENQDPWMRIQALGGIGMVYAFEPEVRRHPRTSDKLTTITTREDAETGDWREPR